MEDLIEAVLEAVEEPGVVAASEVFVVHRPDDCSDAEWDALVAEFALRRGQLAHEDFGDLEI